jgi:hypothetical protein
MGWVGNFYSSLRATLSQRSSQHMGLYDEDPRPTYRNDDGGRAVQTAKLNEAARQKVQDWSAQAGEMAREAATASVAKRAAERLHDAMPSRAERDTYLLGDPAEGTAGVTPSLYGPGHLRHRQ